MESRVVVPVRRAAWLAGELGRELETQLAHAVAPVGGRVRRIPRGFWVEADETPGVLLEAVHRAVQELEAGLAALYPVFHREIGPLWTGTLQAVFAPAQGPQGP